MPLADVVWPALLVEGRIVTPYAIAAGLVAEYVALRWFFGLGWKRSLLVDVVMNATSTLAGIPLIPLAGIAWEFFPGILIYRVLNWGTFNPVTWVATFLIAVLVTNVIEALVMRWMFKIPITKKRFWLLALANTVSVGIAFASILTFPPEL